MTRTASVHDVTIVGSGVAGNAAAIWLAQQGRDVAIVHDGRVAGGPPLQDLQPFARWYLESLNAWHDFLDEAAAPVHVVQSAWGGVEVVEKNLFMSVGGVGWHVDRDRFAAVLRRRASAATTIAGRVFDVESRDGRWTLSIATAAGTRVVRSHTLIDASGRSAAIGRRLLAPPVITDRLVAGTIVATTAVGQAQPTLVEAGPQGWSYCAAVPDGRLAVTLFSDADLSSHAALRTLAGWRAVLDRQWHTRGRMDGAVLPADRAPCVQPAWTQRLPRACGRGWVAIGDAAIARDPLSSSGLTFALASAYHAADAICRGAAHEYLEWIEKEWREYTAARATVYAGEARWSLEPFWTRRRSTR